MAVPTKETTLAHLTEARASVPRSRKGDWTWEMVAEFPRQGEWTEEQYLNREFEGLVEYLDGVLEFLPMPTWSHQFIVDFLHDALKHYVRPRKLGVTAFAPVRVRVGPKRYREPDVLFATSQRIKTLQHPAEGADLVMEVVSPSAEDYERDLVDKRIDYAAAGIPEYWIVDPQQEIITVLTLKPGATEYGVHGEFRTGQWATSALLPEFSVDVAACFAAGNPA